MPQVALPELVIKVSINNQITIGLQNVYRKPKDCYNFEHREFSMVDIKKADYVNRSKACNATEVESFEQKLNRLYPALDIMKKTQRSKKALKPRKGFTRNILTGSLDERIPPFGVNQGQKLRECGAAVDLQQEKYGGASRVITLTLVGDTHEAFECLAANSKYIVNRLFQRVRLIDPSCNNYFYVWEFQKRGALHLHICLWNKSKNMAAKLGAKLVQQWYKILQDIQEGTGVDMFVRRDRKTYTPKRKWQSRNEPMRKSAGGYFSKYAGKASKKEERAHIYHLAKKYPPSRFWGSSKAVKNIIKENTFEYRFESHKTEVSKEYYERIVELLNQKDILSYGTFKWKMEYELTDRKGNGTFKRTITEGFKRNYYYSRKDFLGVKESIWDYIGANEY